MNKPTTFPTPHLSASEAEGRPTIRETMARVLGEADAAQYRPSGNKPSLTALAEHDREQRVFGLIHDLNAAYAAKHWNGKTA